MMTGVCVGVQQKLIGTDILNCGMKTDEMVELTCKLFYIAVCSIFLCSKAMQERFSDSRDISSALEGSEPGCPKEKPNWGPVENPGKGVEKRSLVSTEGIRRMGAPAIRMHTGGTEAMMPIGISAPHGYDAE